MITQRPVSPADDPFLFELYASTRAREMAMVPWTDAQERFHILDITIAERCRNEGIGSAVLESILREADRSRKPTTIYVENFNPSVRLFERLGFRLTATKEFLILLKRPALAAGDSFSG